MSSFTEDKLEIPEKVLEGFLAVKETGVVNMFDATKVIALMIKLKFYEAADWLIIANGKKINLDNKKYTALIEATSECLKYEANEA